MSLSTVVTVAGLGLDMAGLSLLAYELFNGPPAALKAYWDQKHYQMLRQDAKTGVEQARSDRPNPATPKERRRAARQRKKDRKYLDQVPQKVKEVRDAEKALTEHVYSVGYPEEKVWRKGRWGFGLLLSGLLLQMVGAILNASV